MSIISKYLKAHVAGLGAALALVLADLNANGHLTMNDWYGIVGAALGVGAVVATVPNTQSTPDAGVKDVLPEPEPVVQDVPDANEA